MFAISRIRILAVWAAIFAMVAVVTAPAWHRHGHEVQTASPCGHDHRCEHSQSGEQPADQPVDQPRNDQHPQSHHDCAVCVVMHAPTGSGLPGGVEVALSLIQIGLARSFIYDEPVVRFPPVLWSCGPPSSLA